MNQTIRRWGMALIAILGLATSVPALAQYHVTAGRATSAPAPSYGDSRRFVLGGNSREPLRPTSSYVPLPATTLHIPIHCTST